MSPDILERFGDDLSERGVVGERRGAKLLYLTITSRLLDRPVSVAVKGPSSGGKSFLVNSVLKSFPPMSYYALTAMSERALAYSTEPLQHRFLVIYEAAGLSSEFSSYLIRSLLSEGKLRYETVDKTHAGLVPRLIEREGPTGLIVTTTSQRLHPENETRLLSLTVTDTEEQTKAVFQALAHESVADGVDLGRLWALQTWLAASHRDVVIPFAGRLAQLVPAVAVRLRRDFKMILTLVKAHALLHQASRKTDDQSRIVATIEDYCAVRELVVDLVSAGVEASVKNEVREMVNAVAQQIESGKSEVQQTDLRKILRLDKGSISRRVTAAIDAGFVKNLEDRKGRPHRLVLGDPMPEDVLVLPVPGDLASSEQQLRGCAVDGGIEPTPFPVLSGWGRLRLG